MSDFWGSRIKLAIFGESHGAGVGIVIEGLPCGMPIDFEAAEKEMARRAPGQSPLATARKEADTVEILSGVYNGKTTGSAICAVIKNTNQNSRDYGALPRPGHADFTAAARYGGHADMRGGGHFSGRLTAPLVFAGALAKQVLAKQGICVHGRIAAIAGITDTAEAPEKESFCNAAQKPFSVINDAIGEEMQNAVLAAKAESDSVGGVVEVAAFGVPAGWGEPFFNSVESTAASLFFSIPAVKGVEFGAGFKLAEMNGSKANDPLCVQNGQITTETNLCGGILGGITTAQPVTARLAFKPTPSVAKPQQSVNPKTLQTETLETHGRHDPCVVPRAVPVAEAALALALLDCAPQGGNTW